MSDPTRDAWVAFRNGKRWGDFLPDCRDETSDTHWRHDMFAQGFLAALSTTPAPLDLLDAITAETTLPPKPTQYRRGWADAHARIAALIRVHVPRSWPVSDDDAHTGRAEAIAREYAKP